MSKEQVPPDMAPKKKEPEEELPLAVVLKKRNERLKEKVETANSISQEAQRAVTAIRHLLHIPESSVKKKKRSRKHREALDLSDAFGLAPEEVIEAIKAQDNPLPLGDLNEILIKLLLPVVSRISAFHSPFDDDEGTGDAQAAGEERREKDEKEDRKKDPTSSDSIRLKNPKKFDFSHHDKPPSMARRKSVSASKPSPELAEKHKAAASSLPKPAPLLRRKTRSLLDVTDPASAENMFLDPEEDPKVKKNLSLMNMHQRTSASSAAFPSDWSLEQRSAAVIQRWYRYVKVRRHYLTIINDAVGSKKQLVRKRTKRKKKAVEGIDAKAASSPPEASMPASPVDARAAMRREYFNGIRIFNRSPEKGIEYLIEKGLLERDDEEVAKFLHACTKLDKPKVGDYISLGNEFTGRVLESFVQMIDFSGLDFDTSLRKFMSNSNFRLPGEAQKIDRIMTEFGRHFQSYEPKVFASEDTAYILAFSTIMLNTDAHNPSVKKKMTLRDFIKNNSGIDSGKDLPEDFLTKLYISVTQNEIRMKDPDLNSFLSSIEGLEAAALMDAERRFVANFYVYAISDIFSRNPAKSDRRLSLFSDLLIVTKPGKKRHELVSVFHLVKMRLEELPNISYHTNVLELCNSTGRLLTVGFHSDDEKSTFARMVREQVEEVSFLEPEKQEALKELASPDVYSKQEKEKKPKANFLLQYRNSIRLKKHGSRSALPAEMREASTSSTVSSATPPPPPGGSNPNSPSPNDMSVSSTSNSRETLSPLPLKDDTREKKATSTSSPQLSHHPTHRRQRSSSLSAHLNKQDS